MDRPKTFPEISIKDFAFMKESYFKDNKEILVIGWPASGKTTFTESLEMPVIHTDDYMQYGFKDSVYVLLEDLEKPIEGIRVVEGMLGYRLLRKGAETGSYRPDMVIEIKASQISIDARYKESRDPSKLKDVEKMMKGNETILDGYADLLRQKGLELPKWVVLNNNNGPDSLMTIIRESL